MIKKLWRLVLKETAGQEGVLVSGTLRTCVPKRTDGKTAVRMAATTSACAPTHTMALDDSVINGQDRPSARPADQPMVLDSKITQGAARKMPRSWDPGEDTVGWIS